MTAPDSTGKGSSNDKAVILRTNSGIRSGFVLFGFILIIVEVK